MEEQIKLTPEEKEKFNKVLKQIRKKSRIFNIIAFIIVILAMLSFLFSYFEETKECRELVSEYNSDPEGFCRAKTVTTNIYGEIMPSYNINISDWKDHNAI